MRRLYLWLIERATPRHNREWVGGDTREELRAIELVSGRTGADRWLRLEAVRVLIQAPRHWLAVRRTRLPDSPQAVPVQGAVAVIVRTIDELRQDVRYAIRMMRKAPRVTLAAMTSLGLGIGASVGVFSILQATSLAAFTFPEPGRLVVLSSVPPVNRDLHEGLSIPDYVRVTENADVFEHVGAVLAWSGNLGAPDNARPAERLIGQLLTGSMFNVLEVAPAMGRVFTPGESGLGVKAPVAVISHRLWHTRFGGAPSIVGQTMLLEGVTTDIIGVMPAGFRFLDDAVDVWIPMTFTPFQLRGSTRVLTVTGRLKDGMSLIQAQTRLDAMAHAIAVSHPERSAGWGLRARPFQTVSVGTIREHLFLLQGIVLAVLAIACANVAGLLLMRASERHREMVIRSALGADAGRLMRLCFTESLLLATISGAMGVGVAWVTLQWLVASRPTWLSRMADVGVDLDVMALALALSVLTGVACGLVATVQTNRAHVADALRDASRGSSVGRARRRLQGALVMAQIALTLVLLVGGGLVTRSVIEMQRADLGLNPNGVLSFQTRLPAGQYFKPVGFADGFSQLDVSPIPAMLFDRVFRRLQQLPGVTAAAGINTPPLSGMPMEVTLDVVGRSDGTDRDSRNVRFYFVTPGFFKTMEVPALAGRDFTDRDIVNAPWVAIINEAAAERFWPNEDAVGQHLRLNIVDDEQPREVVGLVGSVPLTRWDMARTPMVYVPQLQLPQRYRVPYGQNRVSMTFLLRAREPDAAVVARVRTAVAEIDPRLPVASFQRVEAYLGDQIEAPRYYMLTLTGLGAIASVLAVTGIYGIVAYAIAQRRREMAIRVALGATGRNVVALVVADAARFAVAGLVLGVGAALVLSGLLRGVLWGVATNDPGTFVAVTLTFCLAILIASLMPMRSLIRLDPRAALNED